MNGNGFIDRDSPAMQALMAQVNEQQRLVSEAASRRRQNEQAHEEYQRELRRNQLEAQRMALSQNQVLASNNANPRSVTDTSMTITNGGDMDRSSVARASSPGKSLPPNIEGRYMSLVNQHIPLEVELSSATPARETMQAASYSPADATAYQNAAFARLKDRAGALGRSSVNSLASELANRGISGQSGTFARGLVDRITEATNPLADLTVEHLGQEYNAAARERQLAEQRASQILSSGIQQRGQEMSMTQALNALRASLAQTKYQGEVAQRGQSLDALYRLL